jgi:hypothetical protein
MELEDLLEFLNEAETENKNLLERSTPKLTAKQIGQLANIRVIYTYAHTQSERQKRNRQSSPSTQEALKLMLERHQEYLSMMNKRIRLILNAV